MPDPTGTPAGKQHASGEDPFFVLRDCRELFQRRLADIVRHAVILSPSAIEAFSREIGEAHDELASSSRRDGFEQTDGLTASRITLVGNDDLELDIRIGDIANRLKHDKRIDLWQSLLRYMTLLQRPKMTMDNNPVGLEPIRRGLWTICKESGNSLAQNLDRLERLEEQLQMRLPEVYAEVNDLLKRRHVEPAQAQIVHRAGGGMLSAGAGTNGAAPATNALTALQQALRQPFATESPAAAGSGNVALDASSMVMLTHLLERLQALDRQQGDGLAASASGAARSERPPPALRSRDLDLPPGKPAAIVLDTLSLIFEAIFATPELPDVIKSIIGRLHIPVLRLALLDASFFTDTQHPARQLINGMARAAIGLARNTGRDHPVCASLRKLADEVRTALETNAGELGPCLNQLDALIAKRDQSLQASAQPYAQLVLEHEAFEACRTTAKTWLWNTLAKTTEPAIERFLSDFWLRVMQAACVDGGTEGRRWTESAACIEELLWSVRPKQSAEERKTLLALIPSLIKRINAGLDLEGISSAERAPFLDACFDLQTAALRRRPDTDQTTSRGTPAPAKPGPASAAAAAERILEGNGKRVRYLAPPDDAEAPRRSAGTAWKEGDWISFRLADGEHVCGRHCWQGASSGTILLFNADWGYAVAMAPSVLEQQLRTAQARVVSETLLFDDAAERALGQMAAR